MGRSWETNAIHFAPFEGESFEPNTKAGGIKIRPLSEHQNYNLENVHITTATLIKFTQKFVC
jgi:hypothetical protein